ncbi:MAG TPA: ZIP family metal transporter [Victivallales bacterium]|nr:ZIP family metal transporter [Victivallales bacterium]
MTLYYTKLFSILLIFIITISAGFYPFFKRIKSERDFDFPIGESLAAGVFLGAGLLHMLSESVKGFNSNGYSYPFPFLLAGGVFLLLLFLEHLTREMYEHSHGESSSGFAVLAVVMLSIHAFLAGAALGLSNSMSIFIIILIAILAHKWAASFALAVRITKSALSTKTGIVLFIIFSLMVPIGITFGDIISHGLVKHTLLEPIFTALAAGTFIYFGTLHGLKRSALVECCNLKQFNFVLLGFAIMAIVAIWT